MSRYMDADDVANAIYHHFPSVRTMEDARSIIEEVPSIDIVRCKECKFWGKPWKYNGEIAFGKYCNIGHGVECDADDFCSYGERSSE